jgi:dihydrofolate reductase
MLEAIVAVNADWGIGAAGTQNVVLPPDRKQFAAVTMGAAVIVGRKTLADFPGGRPLKGRHNIVVTRQKVEIEGAQVAHTTEEALALAGAYDRAVVIGGESVYRQFFPYTDRVYVTRIDASPPSDVFFPNLDRDAAWRCADAGEPLHWEGISYRFCVYERVR